MCGIAVAIDWDGATSAVEAMIAGLLQRGDVTDPIATPRDRVAMATRRLRIVDIEHGTQPVASFDGRLLVSFNGEIYNHAALRQELEALGVRFRTESDTEVLASALATWGSRALPKLSGMFAFVAFDLRTGDFLAGRDPLGVKPLYLIAADGGFLFCSEIRPLLAASPSGDVMLLPPGHLFTKQVLAPYETPFSPRPDLQAPDLDALDAILDAAVLSRAPPDLPFALMFSGGIDSTLVAHYARRRHPEAPAYFLGDEQASDYPYAAAYADLNDMSLSKVAVPASPAELSDLIDRTIVATEAFEPSIIRPGVCNYVLARAIHADGFRVALCGEGADELFAGYLPLELAFNDSQNAGAFVREQYLSGMNRSNLQRVDRCAMTFGLETREPFLDLRVIEYALRCGARDLIDIVDGHPRGKAPLRALYDRYPDHLPALIRDRRKQPFSEGAGLEAGRLASPCRELAEESVSDAAFAEGRRQFADFALNDKEELLYLVKLGAVMDIDRVPHLKGRLTLQMPQVQGIEALSEDILVS